VLFLIGKGPFMPPLFLRIETAGASSMQTERLFHWCFFFGFIVVGLLSQPVAGDAGEQWVGDGGIQQLGNISMVTPTGANCKNLHYGGTGSPEKATFSLDTSTVYDNHCDTVNGDVEDAGLDQTETAWTCSNAAGTMTQGSFTSTFTPGNVVKSDIQISSVVYNGEVDSYDTVTDPTITRNWSAVTTFMVTVYYNPGGGKLAEDSTATGPLVLPQSDLDIVAALQVAKQYVGDALGALNPPTGVWNSPGDLTVANNDQVCNYSGTLTTKAESDNGQVGGIRGQINFTAAIAAVGGEEVYSIYDGAPIPDTGSVGTAVVGLTGKAQPYIAAAAAITGLVTGGGTTTTAAIGANSVIQYDPSGPKSVSLVVADDFWSYFPTSNTYHTVDFSGLSSSCPEKTSLPSDSFGLSYAGKSQIQCRDDTHLAEVMFAIMQESDASLQSGKTGDIQATCTIPSYTAAP
jgi:hypothetical protein